MQLYEPTDAVPLALAASNATITADETGTLVQLVADGLLEHVAACCCDECLGTPEPQHVYCVTDKGREIGRAAWAGYVALGRVCSNCGGIFRDADDGESAECCGCGATAQTTVLRVRARERGN